MNPQDLSPQGGLAGPFCYNLRLTGDGIFPLRDLFFLSGPSFMVLHIYFSFILNYFNNVFWV